MNKSHRYTIGLGNATIFLRIRNSIREYYNFITGEWDAAESADTQKFMTEYPDSSPLDSGYVVEFTAPTGGPFDVEIVDSTDSTVIALTDTTSSSASGSGSEIERVVIDHNYEGANALAYRTSLDVGVQGATVTAYLKSDYDADRRSSEYIQGVTLTVAGGVWSNTMSLIPGTYTLVFKKIGYFGPDTTEVTVA